MGPSGDGWNIILQTAHGNGMNIEIGKISL